MATLFNTKISQTYEGLLKTIDNAAITATLKELTDGSGNQSGLYLNTAGDFKVSAILEWGSLKDTGTGVTITRFVTSTDGIENFDNNTSLPTSAAVKLYVDTKFSQTDTLTEVLGFGNTTSGKDIVVSANDDITFSDTSKALFGAGADLQIYHDGTNSYIKEETGTGNLVVRTTAFRLQNPSGDDMIAAFSNDNVKLYYDNSQKLATTNAGVDVTGNLVVSGTITGSGGSFLPLAGGTMTGNTLHGDNVKSIYGTGNALEIYGSTDGFITSLIDDLVLRSADDVFIEVKSGENAIIAKGDGAVELYYNNAKKLETTSTGVAITGGFTISDTSNANANILFSDNSKAVFGAGDDLQIYHDGSNSIISDIGSGSLKVMASSLLVRNPSDASMIDAQSGGAVNLYFDATKRLETVTDGAKVTGNLEVTGTITGSGGSFLPLAGGTMTGDTIHNDNVKSIYGTGSDLKIYHDGSNSYIQDSGTGQLYIAAENFRVKSDDLSKAMISANVDGAVSLFYANALKLATTNTGISVTGSGAFTGSVTIPDNTEFQAGTGSDLLIGHNATDSYVRNITGAFLIDQAAVTQSIVFRVSDANALDTTALTISRNGDLTTGRDVTIAGDLTVNGTTTTVNSQTLAVVDPLIQLAKDNTANSLDIGLYGDYNDGTGRFLGLFSDASDSNKFKLFKGTTVEPTTTVNIGGAGYVAADLLVAGLESSSVSSGTGSFSDVTIAKNSSNTQLKLKRVGSATGEFNLYTNTNSFYLDNIGAGTIPLVIDASDNAYFSGNLDLVDSKKILLGTGDDLSLFHNGTDSFIVNETGNLKIVNGADDKDIIFESDNGSGGTTTYLKIDSASQAVTFVKPAYLTDNVKAFFGNSSDLQIYHDSSTNANMIASVNSRQLQITQDNLFIGSQGATETFITALANGAVSLYYDNSKKFETISTGVNITGTINATDRVNITGSASDLIYYEGSRTGTGVTLRLYDNAGNIYFDGFKGIYLRANQLGGSTGTIGFQGGNVSMSNDLQVSGKVGIGIAPTEVLDLKTSSGDCRVRLDAPSGSDTEVKFFNDGAAQYTIGHDDDSDEFRIALTNVEAPIMTFSKSSVATIGVLSNGQTGRLIVNNEGGSATTASFNSRTNRSTVSIADNDTTGYISSENGLFSIGRNAGVNANNINIDAGNEIGMGTSNPVHKLDLYANQNIPLRIHRPSNANLNINGAWGIGFSTRGDATVSTTDTRAGIFSYYNGNLFLATSNSAIDSNPYASARLIINNLGNVGIGVAPVCKLDVKVGSDERLLITTVSSAPVISAVNGVNGSYKSLQLGGLDLKFLVEGTERVQITNSGNLLINQTAGIAETKLYVEGSEMPETGDAASVEDLLTLYRYGSATVWSGGASLALGRYSTGNGSAPKSRLDFKLKNNAGTNTAPPDTTIMTMQSNGAVGIGTVTPQKPLHIEAVEGSQVLVTSADDTIGTTAGILLRAEGGESNSNLRAKGGVFFEREAANGLGNLILAVNNANNNDSATKTDACITVNQLKQVEINKHSTAAPTLFGENYPQTATLGTNTSVVDTGIIPNAGVYEFYVMGNPNAQGSGAYASIVTGLITIAVDYTAVLGVFLRIESVVLAEQGGGSSNIQLTVGAFMQGNGSAGTTKPISEKDTSQIRLLIGNYSGTTGSNQVCRIIRKL